MRLEELAWLAAISAMKSLLDFFRNAICPETLRIPLEVHSRNVPRQSVDDPLYHRCYGRRTFVFEIRVHGGQQREYRQQRQGQYDHLDDLDGCK